MDKGSESHTTWMEKEEMEKMEQKSLNKEVFKWISKSYFDFHIFLLFITSLIGFWFYSFLPDTYVYHKKLTLLISIIGFLSSILLSIKTFLNPLSMSLVILEDSSVKIKFQVFDLTHWYDFWNKKEREAKVEKIMAIRINFISFLKFFYLLAKLQLNSHIYKSKHDAPHLWFLYLILLSPLWILFIITGYLYTLIVILISINLNFRNKQFYLLLFNNLIERSFLLIFFLTVPDNIYKIIKSKTHIPIREV